MRNEVKLFTSSNEINTNENNTNNSEKKNSKVKYPKLRRLIRHLVSLIENSTSHGLPNVFKTPRPFFKVMWFLLFIASTSLGIVMLTSSVIDDLSWPVVSHIDFIYERPSVFPTVSFEICNNDDLTQNFSLEDFTLSCSWNDKDCDFSDFEQLYDDVGKQTYYKFNSGKNRTGNPIPLKMQTRADSGLYLRLFTGLPKDFPTNESIKFDWAIYISNISMDPVTNTDWQIMLLPGKSYTYLVKRKIISKLGEPYSNCKNGLIYPEAFDSAIYKFIIQKTKSAYRQVDCFNICQSQYLLNVCNSTVSLGFDFQIYSAAKAANNNDTLCFDEHWNDLANNINDACSPYCPLECESVTYDIKPYVFTFTYSDLMQYTADPKLTKYFPSGYNISYQDMLSTVTDFYVLYEDFFYTSISQTAKTSIVDLISNMGGLLGLFIG